MYADFEPETETAKSTETMKTDIILSGVGGQGILSIATIIGEAALHLGLNLKQAEVHGMSQRGEGQDPGGGQAGAEGALFRP